MSLSKADEIFLTLFKDLEIKEDTIPIPGTENVAVQLKCTLNGEDIKHRDVIRLIKQYQDAIIQSLIERK